jgi:hypothetical protein
MFLNPQVLAVHPEEGCWIDCDGSDIPQQKECSTPEAGRLGSGAGGGSLLQGAAPAAQPLLTCMPQLQHVSQCQELVACLEVVC